MRGSELSQKKNFFQRNDGKNRLEPRVFLDRSGSACGERTGIKIRVALNFFVQARETGLSFVTDCPCKRANANIRANRRSPFLSLVAESGLRHRGFRDDKDGRDDLPVPGLLPVFFYKFLGSCPPQMRFALRTRIEAKKKENPESR